MCRRPGHAGHLVEPVGNDIRQLIVLAHPHQSNQVRIARDRIHLSDAIEVGDLLGYLGDGVDVDALRERRSTAIEDVAAARRNLELTQAVITPGSLVELGVNREGTGDGQGPLALDLNQANPGTLQPLQYHLALLV